MLEYYFQAFTTFFVTVEPIALTPIFLALTRNDSPAERRQTAIRGAVIAAGVLLAFGLGGRILLTSLGIGLPALRMAGGVLLMLLAIDMVFARDSGIRSTTAGEKSEARDRQDVAVFPLAVPLIAGPATITAVILMIGQAGGSILQRAGVLAVLMIVLGLTLLILLVSARVFQLLGITGVNVVSRVLGIVLAALAVQFFLDGLMEAGLIRPAV